MAPAGRRHQILVQMTLYFIFIFSLALYGLLDVKSKPGEAALAEPMSAFLRITGTSRVENSPVVFPSAFLGFGSLIASLIGCSVLC